MRRSQLATGTIVFLCAFPQGDLRTRLRPVSTAVKHAGIYHVATGAWTRHGSIANVTGPDTIYNNTCAAVYYTDMLSTEKYQHRSRIPSLSSPVVATIVPGRPATDNDSAPGCANAYLVNGFEVAYCSSATILTEWRYEFASSYTLCGAGDMVPEYTVDVTGLPGGTVTGAQQCWIVNLDISGGTAGGMLLSADGDGTYNGALDEFGFSFNTTNAALDGTSTGPILAGDFTWTGGTVVGSVTPCTGTDGTIWDNPINLAEEGTGMGSQDFFRDAGGPISAPSGPGCYWFGGNPRTDFWLKLYANPGCPPSVPGVTMCEPGVGGVMSCPCGNAPSGLGRGCDNSSGTGGATLTDVGVASLASDTVVFTTTAQRPTALSIVLQGTSNVPGGIAYGDGVRCLTTNLKRLYTKPASGGSISAPVGLEMSVSARSALLGDSISAGTNRYYLVFYRDPLPNGCPPMAGTATFNSSVGRRVLWNP